MRNGTQGYRGECKSCRGPKRKPYYDKNKEVISEKRRETAKTEEFKNKYKEYCNRPETRVKLRAKRRRARDNNPLKESARRRVYKAIKFKKLQKEPCVVCREIKVHAHHENYNKPLEVTWLCNAHHKQLHFSEKEYKRLCKKYY